MLLLKKSKYKAAPTPEDIFVGEKVKLAVHFQNTKFNAENIRSFVLDSLIEKWNITSQLNQLSSATIFVSLG